MQRALLATLALLPLFAGCHSDPPVGVFVESLTEEFDREAFDAVVAHLNRTCPLNDDLHLMVQEIPEPKWGDTSWSGKYVIRIESRQSMSGVWDTLIHEWAHAMVWDASQDPDMDGHGPLWGVAWARAYREALVARQAYYAGLGSADRTRL